MSELSKDDLGVRGHDRVAGALVEELLALLRARGAEDVGEDESDGVEQVGFTGTIRADCRYGAGDGVGDGVREAGTAGFQSGAVAFFSVGVVCPRGDLGAGTHRCSSGGARSRRRSAPGTS